MLSAGRLRAHRRPQRRRCHRRHRRHRHHRLGRRHHAVAATAPRHSTEWVRPAAGADSACRGPPCLRPLGAGQNRRAQCGPPGRRSPPAAHSSVSVPRAARGRGHFYGVRCQRRHCVCARATGRMRRRSSVRARGQGSSRRDGDAHRCRCGGPAVRWLKAPAALYAIPHPETTKTTRGWEACGASKH